MADVGTPRFARTEGRFWAQLLNLRIGAFRWRVHAVLGSHNTARHLVDASWRSTGSATWQRDRIGLLALPGVEVVVDRIELVRDGVGWRDPNR